MIIYALVARGTDILAEFSATTGNFATVTRKILAKLKDPSDKKMSYLYDKHLFHFISRNGLTYLCMAEETFGRRVPFVFLEEVIRRFHACGHGRLDAGRERVQESQVVPAL